MAIEDEVEVKLFLQIYYYTLALLFTTLNCNT